MTTADQSPQSSTSPAHSESVALPAVKRTGNLLEKVSTTDQNDGYIDAVHGTVAEARARNLAGAHETLVAEVEQDFGNGTGQRHRLLRRTGEVHPIIRVVENWQRNDQGQREITRRQEMIGDHLLVRFREGTHRQQVKDFAKAKGMEVRRQLGKSQRFLLAFPSQHPDDMEQYAALVRQGNLVTAVEKDHLFYPLGETPSDPLFGQQWHLHNTGQEIDGENGLVGADIDAVKAWTLATGSRSVKVAVIDSGIDYRHPDLAANIWRNYLEEENGQDDTGNGYIDDVRGWDFVEGTNNVLPGSNNHGTHIAGTIGAIGDNQIGVAGVSRHVSLVPLRVGAGSFPTSAVIEAIDYAVAMGFPISNNSYGSNNFSQELFDAVERSRDAGHLFVAAAGNSRRDIDDEPTYPAAFSLDLDNVITVASSNNRDEKATHSNFGSASVSIAAPGERIFATYINGGYDWMTGTSMAAPQVAAVAALLLSVNPELSYKELKTIIIESVDKLDAWDGIVSSGGRLNAHTALASLSQPIMRLDQWITQDDGDDGTDGNGDRVPNPGETVGIYAQFTNSGTLAANGVTATISILKGGQHATLIGPTSVDMGNIAIAQQATAGPFLIDLDEAIATPNEVILQVEFSMDNGPRVPHSYPLSIHQSFTIAGTVRLAANESPIANERVWIYKNMNGQTPDPIIIETDADGRYSYIAIEGEYTIAINPEDALREMVTVTIPGLDHEIDFMVGAPSAHVDTTPISVSVLQGGSATFTIDLENQGSLPLRWTVAGSKRDYTYVHSYDLAGFNFVWHDVRENNNAIRIPNMGDDTVSPWLPMTQPFPLYDRGFHELVVCANGFAAFNDDFIDEWYSFDGAPPGTWPIELPSGNDPERWSEVAARDLIAFMWTDLDFTAGYRNGTAYLLAQEDRTIIQFDQVSHHGEYDDRFTFSVQAHLFTDGRIEKHIKHMGARLWHSIGIQDYSRERGITVSIKDNATPDKSSIRYTPVDRFALAGQPVAIAPGAQSLETIEVHAGDWEVGEHQATLLVFSNDPHQDASGTAIPVTVTVLAAPVLATNDWDLFDDGNHGSEGNNDGWINPGETIAMLGSVKNEGESTAENARISVAVIYPGTGVAVEPSQLDMGNIAADSGVSAGPIHVNIAEGLPDGQEIVLRYTMTSDNGGIQIYEQTLTVRHSAFLRGTVRRVSDNTPIANATVSTRNYDVETSIQTDVDGQYELHVMGGVIEISVSHDDYADQQHWLDFGYQDKTHDVIMGNPALSSDLTPLEITLYQGQTRTIGHIIESVGDLPVTWAATSDAIEYVAINSLQHPDQVSYEWDDIRGQGAVSVYFGNDVGSGIQHTPLSILMPYFQHGFSKTYVSSQSILSFTDDNVGGWIHTLPNLETKPSAGRENENAIAFAWSHNYNLRNGGSGHYLPLDDRWVFQFNDLMTTVPPYTNNQIHLLPDGSIDMRFQSFATSWCYIALQDKSRTRGNTFYGGSGGIPNEIRYLIQPRGLVHFANGYGTVSPEESQSFSIIVDARNYDHGVFEHTIYLLNKNPDVEPLQIPITVTILPTERVISLGAQRDGEPMPSYLKAWQNDTLVHEETEAREQHIVEDLERNLPAIIELEEALLGDG